MKVTLMTWNVGGAKVLKAPENERRRHRKTLNRHLANLVRDHRPDIVLLQEIACYGKEGQQVEDLIDPPRGYFYKPSVAIDTLRYAHPTRWEPFRAEGGWTEKDYLAQGYGALWRATLRHHAIWDVSKPHDGPELETEEVHLDTGLYTGNRDTEPRLAVVAHFVFEAPSKGPVDVFVVNLHLTTFKGEREGLPERDELGVRTRRVQLQTILHGVVSRYNEWRSGVRELKDRWPATWFLAGDFNCTPDSPEVAGVQRLFADLNRAKGSGTKSAGIGKEPSITVDYVFAGPQYSAFDPHAVEPAIKGNPTPIVNPIKASKVSDHYPVIASLPIGPQAKPSVLDDR
jgi:endonuclease/exonuclease/phosphatase family metal-dependent hydrolase